MRFDWDDSKSEMLHKSRGFSFEEITKLFRNPYLESKKSDEPDQYFAIGFLQGSLLTIVFEYREDEIGLYI